MFKGKKFEIKKASKGLVMPVETRKRLAMLDDHDREATGVHTHHGDACTANQILQAAAALYGN